MNRIKTTIATVIFIFWTVALSAQSDNLIMIRVYEGMSAVNCKILVIQNENILEDVDLSGSSGNVKNYEENAKIIYRVLNKYFKQGFEILNSESGGHSSVLITTYLLEKK